LPIALLSKFDVNVFLLFPNKVTATVDDNNPLDKEVPPRDDGLNHLLAAHVNSKASKLALTEDERKVKETL
jgi:hypothetical protein